MTPGREEPHPPTLPPFSPGPTSPRVSSSSGVTNSSASIDDTFVHDTNISGNDIISSVTGGMKVKVNCDTLSLYVATLAAQDVVQRCCEVRHHRAPR
jgi:small subunit ribosomal protein S14e